MVLRLLGSVSAAGPGGAQGAPAVLYVARIDGIIDLGLAPFVRRVIDEAAAANAAAVVLEINTFLTLTTLEHEEPPLPRSAWLAPHTIRRPPLTDRVCPVK